MSARRPAERREMSNTRAGLLALAVIAVGVFLGFSKDIPFTKPFELRAVFPSANSIREGAAVRIAGVNVGKVARVEAQPGSSNAVVTMKIEEAGLPIHADATAKIRPRIFLEGNFFVDLRPGTPGAPVLGSGDSIKVTQTATPVQLDEVLTALQEDTREDLQDTLDRLGAALGDRPTAEQDERNDPATRGESAAQSLNDAAADAADAARSSAIVADALLGTEPDRDVGRLLRGLADTSAGLARNEEQLKGLVANLNTTMAAFAGEATALREGIRELGPTLTTANDAFARLNAAFPATRTLARTLLPGMREMGTTIDAGFPWMRQASRLLSEDELGGLARALSPASRDLARLIDASRDLFPPADLLAQCATRVVLPTGDVVIQDEFPTGMPNYKELLYAMVALSSEGQNFDGNGIYVRVQPGGGSNTVTAGDATAPGGSLFGNAFPGIGVRPKMPPRRPPYNSGTPCKDSTPPDLNGPWAARGEFGQEARR